MTSITPIQTPAPFSAGSLAPSAPAGNGFGALFDAAKGGLSKVSDLQHASADASQKLALGETDDVIGTMATVEKADIAFKALLAVRSKLMAAFDEVRNMPV